MTSARFIRGRSLPGSGFRSGTSNSIRTYTGRFFPGRITLRSSSALGETGADNAEPADRVIMVRHRPSASSRRTVRLLSFKRDLISTFLSSLLKFGR